LTVSVPWGRVSGMPNPLTKLDKCAIESCVPGRATEWLDDAGRLPPEGKIKSSHFEISLAQNISHRQ